MCLSYWSTSVFKLCIKFLHKFYTFPHKYSLPKFVLPLKNDDHSFWTFKLNLCCCSVAKLFLISWVLCQSTVLYKMELDSVIYHFASKKITLLLWAQMRPLLGSEAKRTTPLCPGSQMLAFLCCQLCCLQEGAVTGVPLCQHYRGPLCVRGGLLLVGLAFTPAVGSWVLALGTLNPTSGHCPSSQAKYLCCFICCPGPRPHQAKDCPLYKWTSASTLPTAT